MSLLTDDSDSRLTSIRVKIAGFCKSDIDIGKANSLGFPKKTIDYWLKGKQPVPYSVLKKPESIFERIEYVGFRASKTKLSLPKFDEKFFYLLGVIYGDGHVSGHIRKKGNRSFRIAIEKGRSHYSEFFLPMIINEVFGIKPKLYFRKRVGEMVAVTIWSKTISRILTNVCGFASGKKSDSVIDFIEKQSKNLQTSFATGLLDTDGGKCWDSFAFCSSSEKTAQFVKKAIENKGIFTKSYFQQYGKYSWHQVLILAKNKSKFLDEFQLKNERKYAGGQTRTADNGRMKPGI